MDVSEANTKTIIEKLSLNKYPTKAILNLPDDVQDFEGMEFDASIQKEQYDLIFMFIFSLEEYAERLRFVVDNQLLKDKGYLFFAYPKKNNKQYEQYIDRDSFFQKVPIDDEGYVLESSIKFSRMVSFNEVFTVIGLKCEPKKAKKAASSKASQCVDDYIVHVDDIKQYLSRNEEVLRMYNELTFGYQKDWARYVYSAKRAETQEKRLLEMETILGEGYKSMDLYRRNK
ncbi:YdeI/OmpD-associated family protein [Paenibacillus marinisediminis]